jgi:hypothetical protein
VVRACGSKFTLSSPPKRKPAGPHFQRTGAGRVRDCGVSPGSSRSTRPPPGAHSTVWTRRRRGRAWPLSRRPGPDARSITAIGPLSGLPFEGRNHAGSSRTPLHPACRAPHHLAVLTRPGVVGAAPTLPGTSRIRLSPASLFLLRQVRRRRPPRPLNSSAPRHARGFW